MRRILVAAVGFGTAMLPATGSAQDGTAALGVERPVVLITGSTDGLGREVARTMAAAGAHVIIHGRSRERGLALVREIEQAGAGSASFHDADFASLAEVRDLAETVLREYDRLDALVNNAGIWLSGQDERRLSADGHELQFAVNYLSGFLLTRMLLPRLRESAPARIVNVASAAQAPIVFDDLMLEHGYSGGRGYAQSKLAQVLFTMDLAEELEGTGVVAVALHPSTLMDTRMVQQAGVTPRSTVDEGMAAVMQALTSTGARGGEYYNVLRPARPNDQAFDVEARRRLRALSETLVAAFR